MQTESSSHKQDLLAKLQQARTLVNECISELEGGTRRKSAKAPPRAQRPKSAPAHRELDFDIHERGFIKAHARGLSDPKKFVLLLAYMTKGQTGKEAQVKDIEKHWNRMTSESLMDGKFNHFYPNRAKEQGWVNTKKAGVYVLRPNWRELFFD